MNNERLALIKEVKRRLHKATNFNNSLNPQLQLLLSQTCLDKISYKKPQIDKETKSRNKKLDYFIGNFIKENSLKIDFPFQSIKNRNLSLFPFNTKKNQTIINSPKCNKNKFNYLLKENIVKTPYQIQHIQIQQFRRILNDRTKKKNPNIEIKPPISHRSISVGVRSGSSEKILTNFKFKIKNNKCKIRPINYKERSNEEISKDNNSYHNNESSNKWIFNSESKKRKNFREQSRNLNSSDSRKKFEIVCCNKKNLIKSEEDINENIYSDNLDKDNNKSRGGNKKKGKVNGLFKLKKEHYYTKFNFGNIIILQKDDK